MTPSQPAPHLTSATSREVRDRLVEALRLTLVGPGAGHPLAIETLPGWERPLNWYLTGFLIPSGTPSEKRADADENDDLSSEIPETSGLAEESTEDRKAAKKGFFPSSMGLSFLVPQESRSLAVTVRWGDYQPGEVEGSGGNPLPVWQRTAREETIALELTGATEGARHAVPASGGLELHVVERPIVAAELAGHIAEGTRSVSVFLVNHRTPNPDHPDLGCTTPTRPSSRRATASRPIGRSWTAPAV